MAGAQEGSPDNRLLRGSGSHCVHYRQSPNFSPYSESSSTG